MTAPRFLCTLSIVLLLALPSRAWDFHVPWLERPISLRLWETLFIDYHDDNFDGRQENDEYYDLGSRLNLRLDAGKFFASMRADVNAFFDTPQGAVPPYKNRFGLEKWSAGWRGRSFRIEAGDFYSTFGRGIALSIRKVDQIGQDTTIMGAKVKAAFGDASVVAFSGLLNPTNFDSVSEKLVSDWMPSDSWYATRGDWLSGARLNWNAADGMRLSGHAVALWSDPYGRNERLQSLIQMGVLQRWATIGGAELDWYGLSDFLGLNVEVDWLHKRLGGVGGTKEGIGLLAGANFQLGDWTIVAEAKHYDKYDLYTVTDGGDYLPVRIDIVSPPTLEPPEMEVANNHTVSGGRVKVSWRPAAGATMLEAAYAGFWQRATATSEDRAWVYNVWLTIEQGFLGSGLANCRLGWREEVPRAAGGLLHNTLYAFYSASVPLGARHSLELSGNVWYGRKHNPVLDTGKTYVKGDASFGYGFSPLLTAAVVVGFDNEVTGSGNLDVFYTPVGGRPIRQVFLAGSLSLNFSGTVVVNLLGGQLRGGAKCINGLCRIYPPFAGVRAEVKVRF
ncbi:MAG: hypothetical protein D6806_10425 [Deltaproteobacteria bacterium]|nr:MAG: hypothetical protein D6806_10425 [Deltaproteobacteria bacterium]